MPGKCVRGMVVEINFDATPGRDTPKSRPCVVIQNDVGNANSHLTIVAPIDWAEHRPKLYPVNVLVKKGEGGLTKDRVVLCEQIRTVDEIRLGKALGKLSDATMEKVNQALRMSLALQ
jgi:mRNA interferase MazF